MMEKKVPFYSLMFSCLVFLSLYVVQEERNTLKKAGSNKSYRMLIGYSSIPPVLSAARS